MKKRTIQYFNKQRAYRTMLRFDDITSFLMAGFKTSHSIIVKKDIVNMLLQFRKPQLQLAHG